ncbi:cytochrome b [Teredinibacter sp. KSP-S5-2]|uniref:cytochrome b n=1 Tax=Teredinibacter sp. KSP-S5-2 TaxID=3034506 RepID=UPI002935150D|nr:cytochrome b [Teredinibacter sp. KSP-S5-2]WNO11077.1 cytochrome b [Teredinibacter sp. KSP-S5-2]
MHLKNTSSSYGILSLIFHWVSAGMIITLFILGLWMMGLDYYDPWYRKGPDLHRSLGILFGAVLLARIIWRLSSQQPTPITTHKPWEKRLSKAVHVFLYLLMFTMIPTGYLITTAKGQSLEVFGLFEIPALITGIDQLEDYAGEFHEIIAFSLIGLAALHALAAVKHHFIDRDKTLLRMLAKGDSSARE